MVPLWFTLSALCFVGAAVLLYVDIDRRRGLGRRRKSWAKSHGFDYEHESADIVKPLEARRDVHGRRGRHGHATWCSARSAARRCSSSISTTWPPSSRCTARSAPTWWWIVRLKDIKEPRESDIWLLGAIGPRMVYSTNLDAARRACDRRMVTFAHTAPDCAEIMWNEQNWTLVSHAGHQYPRPVGRGPAHRPAVQRPAARAATGPRSPAPTAPVPGSGQPALARRSGSPSRPLLPRPAELPAGRSDQPPGRARRRPLRRSRARRCATAPVSRRTISGSGLCPSHR